MSWNQRDQAYRMAMDEVCVIQARPVDRTSGTDSLRDMQPVSQSELALCVLGSGSGGNCAVIRFHDNVILVDAGFGPRTTAKRLTSIGIKINQISALCVTHLDQDHFRPRWIASLIQHNIRLYLDQWHLPDLRKMIGSEQLFHAGLVHPVTCRSFEPVTGLEVRIIRLPHDNKGTIGFLFESKAGRIGYATDLGHVPKQLITHFTDVDLLALESNYDPCLQLSSSRPEFLKHRIMSGRGHLSNQQAFDAVQQIRDQSKHGCLQHVVLLHRSSRCNTPQFIHDTFKQAADLAGRVTLTHQRRPTGWLKIRLPGSMHMNQLKLGDIAVKSDGFDRL